MRDWKIDTATWGKDDTLILTFAHDPLIEKFDAKECEGKYFHLGDRGDERITVTSRRDDPDAPSLE